jgi:cytochrome c oxidase subunit 1
MAAAAHAEQSFLSKYVFSTDHKVIGKQYLVTGFVMAFLGGYLAYVFRSQLAWPGESIPLFGYLTSGQYNSLITMHAMTMIFWVAMPVLVAAFGNLLIPTMIGCDDMAYPTLNMLSYWVFLLSAIVLVTSLLLGGYGGGWTMYPPLSANTASYIAKGYEVGVYPGLLTGGSLLIVAVALEFIAFLMGGINFLVTTINMRADGMGIMDMPIVVWMIDLAVVDFMFSVGPLIAGAIMLLFDRMIGTGFYDPARGGDPILFQHLFWFFGHPEVYVLLLPAIGFVCEVISTFSRKPVFGYKLIVYSAIIASGLSFIVWAHHQFISGIDPRMSTFFSITTIAISIPFAVVVFAQIATLWKGSVELKTPMLWALGWMLTFIIGGVTGIYLGSSAFDIYAHDTYFVVAHFHYTLVPITFFAGFTGYYYWFPKFIGKNYNEFLGKLHFWATMIFFNLTIFPLFWNGIAGQHRRIYDYLAYPSMAQYSDPALGFFGLGLRQWVTVMLIGLILSQFIFVINTIISVAGGSKAEKNPWKANTLEWTCDSPPPHGNFSTFPKVYRGPYEFSQPGRDKDYWPQDEA